MTTLKCYQCPVTLDVTSREKALEEAQKHASAYRHNVGLYEPRNDDSGQTARCIGTVLKWRRKAA